MRSIRIRIQISEDKLICACWCLRVHLCNQVYECMVTDSRAQLPLRSDVKQSRDLRRATLWRWSLWLDDSYEVKVGLWAWVHATSDCAACGCLYSARIPRLVVIWVRRVHAHVAGERRSWQCPWSQRQFRGDFLCPCCQRKNQNSRNTVAPWHTYHFEIISPSNTSLQCGLHTVDDIDPYEPANIPCLLVFEWTKEEQEQALTIRKNATGERLFNQKKKTRTRTRSKTKIKNNESKINKIKSTQAKQNKKQNQRRARVGLGNSQKQNKNKTRTKSKAKKSKTKSKIKEEQEQTLSTNAQTNKQTNKTRTNMRGMSFACWESKQK